MLKRWNAVPRGIRWLAGIVVIALALAIVWALFVPAADWLAHHDVGSAKPTLLQTARDAARGQLLTLAAGLFAGGALVYIARHFTLSRRSLELTEQGQVTERYTKAIEQLGSDKLDVRIGGIYALERVARDSAKDHPTVTEVLAAFIRQHSHDQWPLPEPSSRIARATRGRFRAREREQERSTRPDVQAALTVIGRRDATHDTRPIDLSYAELPEAKLPHDAGLAEAKLSHAVLTGMDLIGQNLSGADLTDANLTDANLTCADLTGANLTCADLTGAWWRGHPTAAPEGWQADATGRLRRAEERPIRAP